MKYFDKYKYLVLKINETNDSKIFQQLLFDNNITWSGNKKIYADRNCVYLVRWEKKSKKGHISIQTYNDVIRNYVGQYNGSFYEVDDYKLVKNLIMYGTDVPSYKPKKIIRSV